MDLFDCHCHLHAEEFDADRDEVIARAKAASVRRALVVAEDGADAERMFRVVAQFSDFLVPAVGVHPDRVSVVDDAEVAAIVALVRERAGELGAVGEVGLDFRPCWDETTRHRQREVLRAMAQVALEVDLPLSVHSRSAGRHAVALLEEVGATKVCMHGFDGRAVYGEQAAANGYFFSIPPSLVRSPVKQKLVKRLPLSALLLESDSPVLAPEPDERNEPKNLRVTLAKMAELRGESQAELALALGENTARLFGRAMS